MCRAAADTVLRRPWWRQPIRISLQGSIKFHIILTLTASHAVVPPRGLCTLTGPAKLCAGSYSDIWAKVFPCVYSSCVKRRKMMFSCLMKCKIISTLSATKTLVTPNLDGENACHCLTTTTGMQSACMCTHPRTHRAELLQPSIPVWLERQMVSLSAHQLPRGAGGGSVCVRLYDCRKNGEGAVVCLQRERKKRFPQECAWTHSHMSTHTHSGRLSECASKAFLCPI